VNGRVAKRLRAVFGGKTQAYKRAKRDVDRLPTSFAQNKPVVGEKQR
jgi:hypothetical protein